MEEAEQLPSSGQQFDETALTILARQASGRENLRLDGWQAQTINGGMDQSSMIQRISGAGQADGQSVPWSLILKTVNQGPVNLSNPQASHYWKREALFYQSGLLADLPGGLRAPHCYACREQAGSYQIFLEDLQDAESAMNWPVESYRSVARSLGQFNGAYLVGRPIPAAEWIPRQWLRSFVEEAAPGMERFFASQDHPILKRAYRTFPAKVIRQAWEQRHELMDGLERAPQTFCHEDIFSRNLFSVPAPGGSQLTVIDWSFSGPAALGTELVALVNMSIGAGTIPFSEGERLTQMALEGYLLGLENTGWHGNPDLVRLAYYVGTTFRTPIATMIGTALDFYITEALYPIVEQSFGMSIEQFADRCADAYTVCVESFQEAMRLKKALRL
jgi:hypothetical protein